MNDKGNALFLILIAVALFAALSYAVTQSGRSGGGVDKEQTTLAAAELIQQVSAMRSYITRLYILDEVDQIKLNDSAYNAAGDIYLPDGTKTTGRTIGIFNTSEGGIPVQYPAVGVRGDDSFIYMANSNLQENGIELGSASLDEFFWQVVSQTACEEINRKLYNSATIPTLTNLGANVLRSIGISDEVSGYSNLEMLIGSAYNIDSGTFPICSNFGGTYIYIEPIKVN